MVFAFNPDCVATSTKLKPSGVPAIGEATPGGGGIGFASYVGSLLGDFGACSCARTQGGVAMASTSPKGRTRAERLREVRKLRRFQLDRDIVPGCKYTWAMSTHATWRCIAYQCGLNVLPVSISVFSRERMRGQPSAQVA